MIIKAAFIGVILLITKSCGYILRELITPNTCRKCEIFDGGTVNESEDECGSGVYNMGQRMKARAYDLGPYYYVECETYKRE